MLSADAPILTRMENLRRATIYAMRDPAVAQELLKTVMARALSTTADSQARIAIMGRRRRDPARGRLQLGEESDIDVGVERGDGICGVADDARRRRLGSPRPGDRRSA